MDTTVGTLSASILVALVAGCARTSAGSSAAEEYAVYGAVIQSTAKGWGAKELLLEARTVPPWPAMPKATCNDGTACRDWDLAKHFAPQPMRVLNKQFELPVEVKLLDEQQATLAGRCPDVDSGGQGGRRGWDWECFSANYPSAGGVLRFSRIAFNKSSTRALVYAEFACGWTCGNGTVYLLELRDGVWGIADAQVAFVS